MTVGNNSYGSAANVAALTKRWTSAGAYTTTSNPTLAEVEGWIDSVSSMMNVVLAGAGFVIPVIQPDAKAAIAQIVTAQVAELCNQAHGTGKFYNDKAFERGAFSMIRAEIDHWVTDNIAGFTALGATRVTPDAQSYSSLVGGVISFDFAEHDE